jgi:hypothetical protein
MVTISETGIGAFAEVDRKTTADDWSGGLEATTTATTAGAALTILSPRAALASTQILGLWL